MIRLGRLVAALDGEVLSKNIRDVQAIDTSTGH